jgi:hypothetical protein
MPSKLTANKLNAIVDAVCYWLGYQFKIGREQLVHEASLRYPVADTITATGIEINQIVLEKSHPIFKNKIIDLVIFDKTVKEPGTEKDDANLKEVYEFKMAKNKTSKQFGNEHQRVFDDIVRLAYYNLWGNKDCYFLMCGEYEEFKTYFVGQKSEIGKEGGRNTVQLRKNKSSQAKEIGLSEKWEPDGLYKDWFDFRIGEEKVKEFNINDDHNWGLKVFQDNYIIREKVNQSYLEAIEVKTKCMAITPSGLENIRTHAVGIWKIEALKSKDE